MPLFYRSEIKRPAKTLKAGVLVLEDRVTPEVIHTYPKLYKKDSNEKTRIWYMELGAMVGVPETGFHRTVAGIENGKLDRKSVV